MVFGDFLEKTEPGKDIMAGIILNTTKLKVYENLKALGGLAEKSEEFIDDLWMNLVLDNELYEEMLYYMQYRTFLDHMRCEGYSLCDLFIWQMNRDNLIHDTGKNSADCNKEAMVLNAFAAMIGLKKNPEAWKRRLTSGEGMDR